MKLTSLKFLLPAVLLTLLVVLTIGSNTINILSVRTLLLTRVETDLDAKIGDKIAAVQASLDEISLDVTVRAGSKAPLDAIQRMTAALTTMGPSGIQATARAYIEGNPNPLGERDTLQDALDGTPYSALHAELNDYYRAAQEEHGYYDVFLINPDGLVVYSVEKEGDFLAKVNEGALADSGLGRAWRRAMSASDEEVAFEDFAPYAPSNGAFAAFVATPVIAPNGKVAGVYAVQVPDLLNDKLSGRAAASGTGRVTVVGNDGLLRSLSGRGTGGALGDPVQMTDQIQAAIDGKRGVMMETQSEDGTTVISAYAPFDAMGATWAIVAEEDREALLAPIRDQVNQFLIERGVLDIHQGEVVGFVVDSGCTYFSPVAFPDTVHVGIRVAKLGNSSVRYEIGVYRNDEAAPAAVGHFVHVYVERSSNRAVPVPATVRAVLQTITA